MISNTEGIQNSFAEEDNLNCTLNEKQFYEEVQSKVEDKFSDKKNTYRNAAKLWWKKGYKGCLKNSAVRKLRNFVKKKHSIEGREVIFTILEEAKSSIASMNNNLNKILLEEDDDANSFFPQKEDIDALKYGEEYASIKNLDRANNIALKHIVKDLLRAFDLAHQIFIKQATKRKKKPSFLWELFDKYVLQNLKKSFFLKVLIFFFFLDKKE